jgi:hypothetical protein
MLEYRQLVEKCRKQRLDQVITNASASHAGVLFENLFIAAKTIPDGQQKEVRIQCGETLAPVFKNFASVATEVMNLGVKIRLLIDSHDILRAGDGFVRAILAHKCGDVRALSSTADRSIRFATVGTSAYRLENDHSTVEAVANFNDPAVSAQLIELFDSNWSISPPSDMAGVAQLRPAQNIQ